MCIVLLRDNEKITSNYLVLKILSNQVFSLSRVGTYILDVHFA